VSFQNKNGPATNKRLEICKVSRKLNYDGQEDEILLKVYNSWAKYWVWHLRRAYNMVQDNK